MTGWSTRLPMEVKGIGTRREMGGHSMVGQRAKAFREPILTTLLDAVGWLSILVSVLGVVAMFSTDSGLAAFFGLVQLGACLFGGLVTLGVSQVIKYIGQTAHYARQIHALLEDSAETRSQSQPGQQQDAPKPLREPPIRVQHAAAAFAACPSCKAELEVGTLHKGMNRCPECGSEFIVE